MKRNCELELYKLITKEDDSRIYKYLSNMGWVNKKEFCVWVFYSQLQEFITRLKEIFSATILNFYDGGFEGKLQENCICINLSKVIGDCVDLEYVFPKEEYPYV